MEIRLYSTHCNKCRLLHMLLQQKQIQFVEINDEKIMIEKGFASVPMLEIENEDGVESRVEVLDFTNAVKWINKQEGENK